MRSVTWREPLYTEQDAALLLALAEYRGALCPACGGPLAECTEKQTLDTVWRATSVVCHRRMALSMKQAAQGDVEHPEANVWSVAKFRR